MTEQSVLETLRRVPDDIILAVMGRDLYMHMNAACLCGWLVREKIARLENCGASTVDISWSSSERLCVTDFGGTHEEWEAIYYGVTEESPAAPGDLAIIEAAFVRRVDEAVFGRGVK